MENHEYNDNNIVGNVTDNNPSNNKLPDNNHLIITLDNNHICQPEITTLNNTFLNFSFQVIY